MSEENNTYSKTRSIYADLSLLLVAILWGGGFIAVKNALDNITPLYITALRFGLATVLMALIFMKKIVKIKKKDLLLGSIIGIFLFGGFTTQTIGLQYTTAGKQAFLTGTYVVMVPFFLWGISKKRPDWFSIISAFLCLVGIGLLTLENGLSMGFGDSLTLICAAFFAAHIVSVEYFAKQSDPIILTIVQLGFVAVASIVSALIFEPMPTAAAFNNDVFFAIGYLVVFSTTVAFVIQNVAQKYTLSTHTAIILCLESVFGSILSVLMLGEKFTFNMVLGCLTIFLAIIISETKLKFLNFNKNAAQNS